MNLEEKETVLRTRLQLLAGEEAGLEAQLRAVVAEKERTFGALRLLEEMRREQQVAAATPPPDAGAARKPPE